MHSSKQEVSLKPFHSKTQSEVHDPRETKVLLLFRHWVNFYISHTCFSPVIQSFGLQLQMNLDIKKTLVRTYLHNSESHTKVRSIFFWEVIHVGSQTTCRVSTLIFIS